MLHMQINYPDEETLSDLFLSCLPDCKLNETNLKAGGQKFTEGTLSLWE